MRRLMPLWIAAALPLAAGCEPTCKQTCDKLLECEEVETPRQAERDCQASCELQQQLYEDWEDTQARDALGELKACVRESECAAIADGACYDPDLYLW